MKSILTLLAILLLCSPVFAQQHGAYKKNQLEMGFSFGGNSNVSGVNQYYEFMANNFHSSLRNPLELLGNLNLTYKRNINKKHFLIADISNLTINKDMGDGWHKTIQYQSASLGYGYLLPVQKLQAMAFANVPYRYKGSEYFIYFEPNDGLWTCIGPTYIHAPTHSIGIGAGLDLNYFLLKNWAIGAKVQYQYFPFDNREFMGSDMDKFRNFAQKTIQTPDLFLLQLKVAYQFNLLRKNNTN